MTIVDIAVWAFLITGAGFFLAGTVGLLRFRDFYSRLHALTKADNVGLGLITVGLAIQGGSLSAAAKLVAIWGFAVFASATSCYLISNSAHRAAELPAREPPEGAAND
jgi:multicomponent Na+:H+ antiporter subunit G